MSKAVEAAEEIIRNIKGAQTGDRVWLYHPERAVYVDGKYAGRGAWDTTLIEGRTKQSIIAYHGMKFDAATGRSRPKNGFNSDHRIAGEDEREADLWRSYYMIRAFESAIRSADLSTLKEAARVLGVAPPSALKDIVEG